MKKTISVIVAVVLAFSCFAVIPFAADTTETLYQDGDVQFVVRNEQAYVTEVETTDSGAVIIPAKLCTKTENIVSGSSSSSVSLNGISDDDNDAPDPFGDDYLYTVSIEAGAFDKVADTMTSLSLPRYINNIEIDALRTPKLAAITVNANNKTFYSSNGSLYSFDKKTFIFHPEASSDSSILSSVTAINASAFRDSLLITSLTLPASVSEIPEYCFSNCQALATLTIPSASTLATIDSYAFSSTALKSVNLGTAIKTINAFAFYNSSKLTSLVIPELATGVSVGAGAFIGCPLSGLTIYRGVTSIGEHAFGYYYDTDLVLQPYSGFTITGYKYTTDRTAKTDLFNYADAASFSFIPLDPMYNFTFSATSIIGKSGTVYLYSGKTLKYTLSSTTGSATFNDIAAGTYSIYFTKPHGVLVKSTRTITTSGVVETYRTSSDQYIPIGDVNADGRIDVNDLTAIMISLNFGTKNTQYDINDDGVVNITDVSTAMLSANYGSESAVIA